MDIFYRFFAQTLAEHKFHNMVHIMIVNSSVGTATGEHWFLVSWLVETGTAGA